MEKIRKTLGRWFAIPWYSILFGAYPVLALMAVNVGQIKVEAGWRALIICLAFAGILFLLLRLILRDWNRAAFLSALWMALFFSYGHVFITLTEKFSDVDFESWLLLAWLILFLLAILWAVKRSPSSPAALNVIALGLVVMSLWQIQPEVRKGSVHRVAAENAPVDENLTRPENPPDVYYFILDMYTRADLLQEAYGYDNSAFLDALRARGFYVAQCSQSNYVRTELSVASSLNMAYLQGLDSSFDPESIKRRVLWDSYKHNAVRYNFETLGYKTIAFATGFAWNELDDADVFFTPPPFSAGMTEFETLFLNTTLARYVKEFGWVDADEVMGQNFRDRTLLVFDSMGDIARMDEPTFAYVHLISPHPPFVFGPNGEPTYPPDFWNEKRQYPKDLYARGYQNQLTFLNQKVLEAVDTLIAESDTPPIIILQGDHGPWLQSNNKRMWILNAYYLPNHDQGLYPTISPVNSFRYIFDEYFKGNYDMLPDVSYFSPVPKLYNFSEVKNNCK
ncbi:MAG: sulfatase-like hydrolase/transferase [Anaerolineales bacterium]|nr:sulfatase-like hydrolase/transferase [Anaerolineales bacterium]